MADKTVDFEDAAFKYRMQQVVKKVFGMSSGEAEALAEEDLGYPDEMEDEDLEWEPGEKTRESK